MPDVFISYSTQDSKIAQFIYRHLNLENLSTFLAQISLEPGQKWEEEILRKLKESQWVLFLASISACSSPIVHQEMGVALGTGKQIVPIVWDMDPADLPGWLAGYQALDLRKLSLEEANMRISNIAKKIKADVFQGKLIAGAVFFALLFLLAKGK
jgi:hypothetical protein